MTRHELLGRLRDVMSWPDLTEETTLRGEPRRDSLAQIEVLVLIRDTFGNPVELAEVQDAGAVRDLMDLVVPNAR